MPDRDFETDPLDQAYRDAEAMIDDDVARAERRARFLARLAAEPARTATVPPVKRTAWVRGGWLAAACVIGLSVVLASQLYPTVATRQPTASNSPPAIASRLPAVSTPPAAPSAKGLAAPPSRAVPKLAPASAAATNRVEEHPIAAPASVTFSATPLPAAPAPLSAPPPPPPAPPPPAIAAPGPRMEAYSRTEGARSVLSLAVDLRAAATADRVADMEALLAQGVPVDAPDNEGETALMKAIREDHPATAALLLRHGARLDHVNHAGQRATDLARLVDDPELDRALNLAP